MELTKKISPQNRRQVSFTSPIENQQERLLERFSGVEGLSTRVSVPAFSRDPAAQRQTFHYPGHKDESPRMAADHPYQIELEDGSVVHGTTDKAGLTQRVAREVVQQAEVKAGRETGQTGGNQ